MKNVLHKRLPCKSLVPQWDQKLLLDVLCDALLEPKERVNMNMFSYKTALLLELCSAKRELRPCAFGSPFVHLVCTRFVFVLVQNGAGSFDGAFLSWGPR